MNSTRSLSERIEAYLFGLALGCLVVGVAGGIAIARVAGWGHTP
jgi:hypothetical protein